MKSHRILLALSLLVVPAAHAQETDPLWRVINTAPADVVPLYGGQLTPFPLEVVERPVGPSPEELQRMADMVLVNQTQEEIKKLMQGSNAFLPNVNGLVADAYMKGGKGSMALIGGHWYGETSLFEVPSFKNPEILSKINFLRGLDGAVAQGITTEFNSAHAMHNTIRLEIEDIEPKQIVFKGPNGKIILPVRQKTF